ncbi:MAG: 30S ribosomal protein S12 methylthiotransferase RimO [Kiritimatiellae bacterium]|nr:30S ribosomal protein S12 methylthiotransferase RimO [Kiritimatiellia bacterium]
MSVSVGFISLGCSKNLVDSQIMAGYLKSDKIALAPTPESADMILVNTCAFIEAAREETAEAILSACEHKKNGCCRAVIVTGCMVQRYREQMLEAFPDVDAFLGVDELDQIAATVRKLATGKCGGLTIKKGLPVRVFTPKYPTLLFTGGPFAYLKIAEGCDHRCAYCAIPDIRGNFRSRGLDEIVTEAAHMVSAGVRELNLISQDTLHYGMDRGESVSITDLSRAVDEIDGEFWFRLLYGHPAGLTEEMLEVMNQSHHLCRYLDLPVQHSHPDILHAMNRGKAVAATAGLAERLRQAVPGVVLRTTCMVGFPSESDEHFNHLLEYVAESKFDHLGVFAFSPEEGTPAFAMDGVPDEDVVADRCERLMELQRAIVEDKTRRLVGQTDKALLLCPNADGEWLARLPRQAPEVDGETVVTGVRPSAHKGDFVKVMITGGKGYDLTARATH